MSVSSDGTALTYITGVPYPTALISAEDGAYLFNAFTTGASLKISFPQVCFYIPSRS